MSAVRKPPPERLRLAAPIAGPLAYVLMMALLILTYAVVRVSAPQMPLVALPVFMLFAWALNHLLSTRAQVSGEELLIRKWGFWGEELRLPLSEIREVARDPLQPAIVIELSTGTTAVLGPFEVWGLGKRLQRLRQLVGLPETKGS
jgi:hypothetical protein